MYIMKNKRNDKSPVRALQKTKIEFSEIIMHPFVVIFVKNPDMKISQYTILMAEISPHETK